MEINIVGRKSATKSMMEQCLRLLRKELKLERSKYSLLVMTEPGMAKREGMRGVVSKVGPKTIAMVIDTAMDLERLIITLSHEMVHVKQYAKGQVTTSKSLKTRYWMGKKVRADYYNQPWEIEAYSKERLLANKIFAIIDK